MMVVSGGSGGAAMEMVVGNVRVVERKRNGVECCCTILEIGGDDLHNLLKSLRQPGQELP